MTDSSNGAHWDPELIDWHAHERQRAELERARAVLDAHGSYAYILLNEVQEWCVAVEDETGHVEVTVAGDRYRLEGCVSVPGIFMDEESEWRQRAMERLARRVLANMSQGMLEPHQRVSWVDDEHGICACVERWLSVDEADRLPVLAAEALREAEDVVTMATAHLRS